MMKVFFCLAAQALPLSSRRLLGNPLPSFNVLKVELPLTV